LINKEKPEFEILRYLPVYRLCISRLKNGSNQSPF